MGEYMQRILLVDDEQYVLDAVRHGLGRAYDIETSASPREALQRAKETTFSVVVSDYFMPEMDGLAFLENFGQQQPDAVRLILSGHADMDVLIKAINVAHIYRFLPKPIILADLKANISQALDYRDAILENRSFAEDYRQRFGTLPQEQQRKMYRVLLVSPDEKAVTSMWRELTHHSTYEGLYGAARHAMFHRPSYDGHDVHLVVDSFASPLEALEYLKNNRCDLVIADFAMPGMDGVAFCCEVRLASPDTACILVSESMDMPSLSNAINHAHIDDFLKRSWNSYELKFAVMRALRYRDLLLENRALADMLRDQTRAEGQQA